MKSKDDVRREVERNGENWSRSSGKPGGREVERVFPRGPGQRQEPAPSGGYVGQRDE